MWNDFKLRQKAPPRRFLLLVESRTGRSPQLPESGTTVPARTSPVRRPASNQQARIRRHRHAVNHSPAGWEQGLPGQKASGLRTLLTGEIFSSVGLGHYGDHYDDGPARHGTEAYSAPGPAPVSRWAGLRALISAALLIGGLGSLSFPAHYFITNDLPAAAAAALPALASLWMSARLASPASVRK